MPLPLSLAPMCFPHRISRWMLLLYWLATWKPKGVQLTCPIDLPKAVTEPEPKQGVWSVGTPTCQQEYGVRAVSCITPEVRKWSFQVHTHSCLHYTNSSPQLCFLPCRVSGAVIGPGRCHQAIFMELCLGLRSLLCRPLAVWPPEDTSVCTGFRP